MKIRDTLTDKLRNVPNKSIIALPLIMAIMLVAYSYIFPTSISRVEPSRNTPASSSSDTPVTPLAPNGETPTDKTDIPESETPSEIQPVPLPDPITPSPTPVPAPTPTTQPTPAEISRGNTAKQQVIFTFDGGAGSQSLSPILATLQKYGVKGTFFVTGKWAEANQGGLSQIRAGGHEVFNHTYSHPDLTAVPDATIAAELQKAEHIISPTTGTTTKPYFRPPYGARNSHVRDIAWAEGYRSVYWTVDALDWQQGATPESVKSRILNSVSPGTIYLVHIGDDITGQILDEVFSAITARSYKIVSLTQGL